MMTGHPDSIRFASSYVYSPVGMDAISERSRLLCALLKTGDSRMLGRYALRVRQQVREWAPLAGYLGATSVLVPIPGCTCDGRRLTVSGRLSLALLEAGVGRGIWLGLRRVRSVTKSATAAPGERPSVSAHYDSFAIDAVNAPPPDVVLVDDVITKGRTLLAAAARLRDTFPSTKVRAFALLRTMGWIPHVDHLIEPCIGAIEWRAGDAYRSP